MASAPLVVTTATDSSQIPATGQRLWLRADMGATPNGSGVVTTWVDQSSAHNDAVATGPAAHVVANALHGQPAMRLDGQSDGFQLPDVMNGAGAGEIFIIARLKDFTNPSNGLIHFGGSTGTFYHATQIWNDFGGGDNQPITLPDPSVLTSLHLFDASMSGGTGVVQINGVEISRKPNVGTYFRPNPLLGADWQGEHFNGDIAEVIVYDHVLSAAERAPLDRYFYYKYGIVSYPYSLALTDPNGDADSDGLTNAQEINIYHTNPLLADTDGDGLPDGWEVAMGLNPNVADANGDADGDGVPNKEDARPNNPAIGRLTVTIQTPADGSSH